MADCPESIVLVKLSPQKTVKVNANFDWNVLQLKEAVSERTSDVNAGEISLLFQGKVLNDNDSLKSLDLGNFSYLHAVKSKKLRVEGVRNGTHGNVENGEGASGVDGRSHYFVYCKKPCKRVCPGKLRVRCCICKQGSFVVKQGPNKWSDVLDKNQIEGVCQTDHCVGSYADFYFKCTEHQTDEGESSVPLPLIQRNSSEVECLGCGDVESVVLVYPCESGHTTCLSCFKEFAEISLRHRDFVYTDQYGFTISCPNKCPNSFINDPHYFRILGDELYDRYQRLATELCVIQNGGILCPSPNCENAMILETGMKNVRCDGCQMIFCSLCLAPSHRGDCEAAAEEHLEPSLHYLVDPERAARARWDLAAQQKIREISKPCPQCRSPTEKSDGCNHMTCTALDPKTGLKCGYQWCWVCVKEWSRDCQALHWFPDRWL